MPRRHWITMTAVCVLLHVALSDADATASAVLSEITETSVARAELMLPLGVRAQQDRFLNLTVCSGPGCPYMGAWLAHTDQFMKPVWNLQSRKMEEATFLMFNGNRVYQTQLEHHVKHMSAYEHSVNNQGVSDAIGIISGFVNAAYNGECDDLANFPAANDGYLVLIPFFGGIPPSATMTLDQGMPTNGEGHSKMSPELKSFTCMATICSCLKYFGRVVVGVTSDNDENLLHTELNRLNPIHSKRVTVLRFAIPRPSALPFHLLTWGQRFVMHHNCRVWNRQNNTQGQDLGEAGGLGCHQYKYLNNMKNIQAEHRYIVNKNRTMHFPVHDVIEYIYYTESDQRAEKYYNVKIGRDKQPPEDYRNGYFPGRYCGAPGFQLSYQDGRVRKVQ